MHRPALAQTPAGGEKIDYATLARIKEEGLQRSRADALRREVALLDQELALTTVRAPASGTVLTPRVEELVGSSLAEGDKILALGRTDNLELDVRKFHDTVAA